LITKFLDKIFLKLKSFNFFKVKFVRGEKIKIKINSGIELWRSRAYEKKEPETLDWIDNFNKGDVFYDVGANIGVYSLYASKKKCKVYAFEPASNNYSSLLKNIEINKLNICSYGIGFSNKEKISILNLVSTIEGDSQHNLNKSQKIYSRKFKFGQGTFITSLDNLIYKHHFPIPNHIKIDVDGHEKEILLGAKKILKSKKLKSVMIEINFKNHNEYSFISNIMKKNNFHIKNRSKRVFTNKLIKAQNIYFFR